MTTPRPTTEEIRPLSFNPQDREAIDRFADEMVGREGAGFITNIKLHAPDHLHHRALSILQQNINQKTA